MFKEINTNEAALNINTRYQPIATLRPANPTKLLAVGRAWIQTLSDDASELPETEAIVNAVHNNVIALEQFAGDRKPIFTITLNLEADFSPRSRLSIGRFISTAEMQERKISPFFQVNDMDGQNIGKATVNRYNMSHIGHEEQTNEELANETGRLLNSVLPYVDAKYGHTAISLVFDRDMPMDITLPKNSKLLLFTNSKRDGKLDADFRISIETDRKTADEFIATQQANRTALAEKNNTKSV